jgi:type VI protein secretion system component Hcp
MTLRNPIRFSVLALLLVALGAGVLVAADHICLIFASIDGDDPTKGACQDNIEVRSVSFGVTGQCPGGGATAPPIVLVKDFDTATAGMYEALAKGTQGNATIEIGADQKGVLQPRQTLALSGARLTDVTAIDSSDLQPGTEQWILHFDSIAMTYYEYVDGSPTGPPHITGVMVLPTCSSP